MLNSAGLSNLTSSLSRTNWGDVLQKNSINTSYLTRGMYRVDRAVPRDRSLDYIWRDIFMVLVSASIFESSFRITDQFFTMPNMAQILELNRLPELYKADPLWKNHNIQAYDSVPGFLRENMVGSLFRSNNFHHTPDNIENLELPKLAKYRDDALKALDLAKKEGSDSAKIKLAEKTYQKTKNNYESAQVLHHHIRKRMSFPKHLDFLIKKGAISASNKEEILNHLADMTSLDTQLDNNKVKLDNYTKQIKELIQKGEQRFSGQVLEAFTEGNASREAFRNIGKVTKYGKWLGMIPNIGLTFLIYGLTASYLDNNVVQPLQSKLVKKYGDVKFTQLPSFAAIVPSLATLMLAQRLSTSVQFIRNHTGHVSRYALSSIAAFAVYLGVQALGLKYETQKMDKALEILPEIQAQPQNRALLMPESFRAFKPKSA